MSDLSTETIMTAVTGFTAVLYALKRLSSLDLVLRRNRERERAHLVEERLRRVRNEIRLSSLDLVLRSERERARLGEILVAPYRTVEAGTTECLTAGEISARITAWYEATLHAEISASADINGRVQVHVGSTGFLRTRALIGWLVDGLASAHIGRSGARLDIPCWVLALLSREDADRLARESAAHLHERIANGELREARVDRRRFVRYALVLAATRRVHRMVSKSR